MMCEVVFKVYLAAIIPMNVTTKCINSLMIFNYTPGWRDMDFPTLNNATGDFLNKNNYLYKHWASTYILHKYTNINSK